MPAHQSPSCTSLTEFVRVKGRVPSPLICRLSLSTPACICPYARSAAAAPHHHYSVLNILKYSLDEKIIVACRELTYVPPLFNMSRGIISPNSPLNREGKEGAEGDIYTGDESREEDTYTVRE